MFTMTLEQNQVPMFMSVKRSLESTKLNGAGGRGGSSRKRYRQQKVVAVDSQPASKGESALSEYRLTGVINWPKGFT